jgi:beta-mannosidase
MEPGQARLAVMNGGMADCAVDLRLRVFAMDGRQLADAGVALSAAASASVETVAALPAFDEPVVAELLALDRQDGRELARDCAWTEPFKFYRLGGARLRIERDGDGLSLSTDRPVKGLWLQPAGAVLADNFIDLFPGSPRHVGVAGHLPEALQAVALDEPGRIASLIGKEV